MAKINLVCAGKHTTEFLKLALSLRSRSIDLRLWIPIDAADEYSQLNLDLRSDHFEIVTPITKNPIRDMFQILPRMALRGPEVFHFFLEDQVNVSSFLLLQFLKTFPQHRVILSLSEDFIDNIQLKLDRWLPQFIYPFSTKEKIKKIFFKSLCYRLDALTVESYTQLVFLHQTLKDQKRYPRRVLPPSLVQRKIKNGQFPKDHFFEQNRNHRFLFVPLTVQDKEQKILHELTRHFPTCFFGDFEKFHESKWNKTYSAFLSNSSGTQAERFPFYFYQSQSPEDLPFLDNALIFIAGLHLTQKILVNIFALALNHKIPVIMDMEQSMTYSGLWSHGQNAWIIEKRSIVKNPSVVLRKIAPLILKHQFQCTMDLPVDIDGPLNELSRLYQQLLPVRLQST